MGFLVVVISLTDFPLADFCPLFCREAPGERASQEGYKHLSRLHNQALCHGVGWEAGGECNRLAIISALFAPSFQSLSFFFPLTSFAPVYEKSANKKLH